MSQVLAPRYSMTETSPVTRPECPRGLMLLGGLPQDQLATRSITTEQRDQAKALVGQLELWLAPAPRGRVLARIVTLLEHFWTSKRDPAVERAIAEDWADALKDQPWFAIEAACKHWRDTQTKTPKIADILRLSNAERRHDTQALDCMRKVSGIAAETVTADDRQMSPELRALIDDAKRKLSMLAASYPKKGEE